MNRSEFYHSRTGPEWPELFANPATEKPYHQEEIQKKHIRAAAKAAGIKSKVGWKTFRHSFRSWLDQTEAPIGVQRELIRHASIQTTMNVYGCGHSVIRVGHATADDCRIRLSC